MDVDPPPLYGQAAPPAADDAAALAAASDTNIKRYELEAEHELRVETRPGHAVVVALISGKAEIFGAELQLGERREVSGGCPFAVFTWTGATVALSAASLSSSSAIPMTATDATLAAAAAAASLPPPPPLETAVSMVYVASHTPMPSYLNAHDALEARRELAAEAGASAAAAAAAAAATATTTATGNKKKKKEKEKKDKDKEKERKKKAQTDLVGSRCRRKKRRQPIPGEGPRAIVVGPTNAGKSTICKILLNYAVRSGWRPTFVDLDVGQGALAPPGCLAACPVDSAIAADSPMPDAPLAFFFGSASPADNLQLFKFLVRRMANLLDRRSEVAINAAAAAAAASKNDDGGGETASRSSKGGVGASGWVVNWPGWCEGDEALTLLEDVVRALSIDTVLVVGNERLHAVLKERLAGKRVGGGGGGGGDSDDGDDGDDDDDDEFDAPSPSSSSSSPSSLAPEIVVANLPRSEGAVVRDVDTRRAARSARVKEYFYGPPVKTGGSQLQLQQQLRPAALRLRRDELEILRIGGGATGRPRAPATALPIGHGTAAGAGAGATAAVAGDGTAGAAGHQQNGKSSSVAAAASSSSSSALILQLEKRDPGPDLVHSLLALSHSSSSSKSPSLKSSSASAPSAPSASASAAERALSDPVAGFLYVTAVDAHTGAVTVLAPCAGALPSKVALAGSVKVFLE